MNPLECPISCSSSSSSSSLTPSPVSAFPPTPGAAAQRQLSHADKLRKVINELVETEKTYVKVSIQILVPTVCVTGWSPQAAICWRGVVL